ncbi:MAG: hypothetical protein GC192_15305 [Bacteroidetes bacterium]|nr:hypothetical protein [Bacteroidota bacterium]
MKEFFAKFVERVFSIITVFGFIGILLVTVNIVIKLFDENSPNVAHGTNKIWITLLIFLFFLGWQIIDVIKGFSPNSKGTARTVTIIIMWISFICAALLLITCILGFYGPEWVKGIVGNGPHLGYTPPDSSLFIVLLNSFFEAGIIGGAMFAMLVYLLRFGIFTSGLSFCVALHNFFNGLEFDLSVLYETVFNLSIPELWGVIITIGHFLITYFIGGKLTIPTSS